MSCAPDAEPDSGDWIKGGGEIAGTIRALDWSKTPLGPLGSWPQSLRTAVCICLNSRFPMFIWWGPELTFIYNDGYAPILGKRHPAALGRSGKEVWAELWPVLKPQVEAVMQRGESTWNERVQLLMERNGFPEDAWFTFSYSPIFDGDVQGLFCAVVEETPRVLTERERDRQAEQRQRAEERATAILESVTEIGRAHV